VWRLDGPSASIASALVDQAIQSEAQGGLQGQACIDRRFGDISRSPDVAYGAGDWDLRKSASFLLEAGISTIEDENSEEFGTSPAPACPNAALYSGWYSYYNYNDAFTWQTGAIGWHLDSAAAVDIRGGGSWAANALAKGIAVTTGPISEPYLEGLVRPGGAFRNLLEGASVGDAFLRNTRWLKWETLYVGDPLYTPFPNGRSPFHPLQPVNSIQLSPRGVVGGTSATGTISLNAAAPSGGTTFALTSETGAAVPATVLVPAGATKATFPITTSTTTQSLVPQIVATAGVLSLRNTLTVLPLLGGFAASPSSTMAGIPVTCTATLNARAPAGGAVIQLSSDNPNVIVPATVTVPAGSTVATFTANTLAVSSKQSATITGTLAGASATFVIDVYPGISAVHIAPSTTINAGTSIQIQVVLPLPVPAGNTATVQFTSSDSGALAVPPSMVIPAGSDLGYATAISSAGSSGKVVTLTVTYGGSTVSTNITIN
jgi:hypothetical protein